MAWNYKHNTTLPNNVVVDANDNNLRGNVCYIDATNGYANQAAVTAVNPAAEVGSANYPYNSFTNYKADIGTHGIYISIIAKGVYSDENLGVLTNYCIVGDEKWNVKFIGSGINAFCSSIGNTASNYGVWYCYFHRYTFISSYAEQRILNSIIDCPLKTAGNSSDIHNNIILGNRTTTQYSTFDEGNIYFNNSVTINFWGFTKTICYNVTLTCDTITIINNSTNIFWLGTITVGGNSYDIAAAIGLGKSEATIQSEIGTLFGVTFVGRILNPRFINTAKGNFAGDWINYPTETGVIFAIVTSSSAYRKGIKCEWDAVLATSDYIFSASSPHYSALDGFNGLICRNLNADGSIVNTAYDTVAVSKIITLPLVAVLDFLLQFGTFGAGALEWDELYVRAVASGAVEDEYSITSGYEASYTANVFTCDWPRFYLNREQKCNKVGDKALGSIDKGAYNLDEARSIFKTGAIEFQFILVKRGV